MRVLNHTEIETVSGGCCWLMWSWCKPKTTTCTPPTKTPTCTPVKTPTCGTPTPTPTPEVN